MTRISKSKRPFGMTLLLPDDILYMICAALGESREFDTLYSCACSGKRLAIPALSNLYRIHDVAPVTNGGSDEIEVADPGNTSREARRLKQEVLFKKWAGLWKTLILSSLDKTFFPYSRYIRTLNLQDLGELLQESKFRDLVSKTLFEGELAVFKKTISNESLKHKDLRLDVVATINSIGEVITKETSLLEEMSGNIDPDALARWIPRLPQLKGLHLWNGEALANTGELISTNCPSFRSVKFWDWKGNSADHHFATFIEGLRPQSLESLEIFSNSDIGAESFLALNRHSESLTELKLGSLIPGAVPSLSLLKECTNLDTLSLAERGPDLIDLENLHNEAFLELVSWLRGCKNLRSVTFTKFLSALTLLTPVFFSNSLQLTKLELQRYTLVDSSGFHQALAQQTSLQILWLKGEAEEYYGYAVDVLVTSLCALVNLTDLRLRDISDFFRNQQICQLAKNLPRLETWCIGGSAITDAIWNDVAELKQLRRLDLSAVTCFTADGIIDFVETLGPGNKGFSLAVMMADVEYDLDEDEQSRIREILAEKLDGRFEFTLWTDPGVMDFEDESD